jgi:hypothetical protein
MKEGDNHERMYDKGQVIKKARQQEVARPEIWTNSAVGTKRSQH